MLYVKKTVCFIDVKTGGITRYLCIACKEAPKFVLLPQTHTRFVEWQKRPKYRYLLAPGAVAVHAPTQPGSGISGRQRPRKIRTAIGRSLFFFFILNARSKHFITLIATLSSPPLSSLSTTLFSLLPCAYSPIFCWLPSAAHQDSA